jgi:hypothetical protein
MTRNQRKPKQERKINNNENKNHQEPRAKPRLGIRAWERDYSGARPDCASWATTPGRYYS